MKIKKLVNFFIVVISVLFLVACNTSTVEKRIGDGGLLSGEPCSAPCFEEIIPGESTKDEAIESMEKIGFDEYEEKNNKLLIFSNSIDIFFNSQNIVYEIGYDLRGTNITVQDVTDKYGSPDWVFVFLDDLSGPDTAIMWMRICYTHVRMCTRLEYYDSYYHYSVGEETKIEFAYYYDLTTYNTVIEDNHITNWHGYGDYDDPSTD